MALRIIPLNKQASAVSLFAIEAFLLATVFFLPFSKSITEATLITALVLWALRKFPCGETFPSVGVCNIAYAAFLAMALLGLLHVPAADRPLVIRGFFKWLKYLGTFFMCAEVFREPARRNRVLGMFIGTLALVCVNGWIQMYTGEDIVKGYSAWIPGRFLRMQGAFSSPNDLAAFLLMGLPLVFALWLREERWSAAKIVFIALSVFLGVSFIATLSRGAFLSLFASCLFFAAWKRPRALLVVLAAAAVPLAFSPMLRHNFLWSLNPDDITVSSRLHFWGVTWDMIRARPFLGHGINRYYRLLTDFAPGAGAFRGYAHNCYLQIWSETGLAGLLVFLVPVGSFLRETALKAREKTSRISAEQALHVGLLATLVQSAVDTNLYALQAAFLFWIFWGISWSQRQKSPCNRSSPARKAASE